VADQQAGLLRDPHAAVVEVDLGRRLPSYDTAKKPTTRAAAVTAAVEISVRGRARSHAKDFIVGSAPSGLVFICVASGPVAEAGAHVVQTRIAYVTKSTAAWPCAWGELPTIGSSCSDVGGQMTSRERLPVASGPRVPRHDRPPREAPGPTSMIQSACAMTA
jgi:hypothetical protein